MFVSAVLYPESGVIPFFPVAFGRGLAGVGVD